MEEDVVKLFLNGIPFKEFLPLYIWALIGAIMSFARTADKARRKDPNTPNKWSWPHLWKGVKRTLITMGTMAIGIIFWNEISLFLFNAESAIELTMWSAFFVIGIGSDKLTEVLFGGTKDIGEYVKKIAKK